MFTILVKKSSNNYRFDCFLRDGEYLDSFILYKGKRIGNISLIVSEECVFIRHISIIEDFRRQGHGENIINELFKNYKNDIRFFVAQDSISAINFWNKYSENKKVQESNTLINISYQKTLFK